MKWHAKHCVIFREWLIVEVSNEDCPATATVSDLYDWLRQNADLVRLQALFVVEHDVEVFELMERVQVAVSSTFNCEVTPKPKPNIHRVYNRVHNLHSCLQQIVSSHTLRHLIDQRLNRKRSPAGPALYDIALWKKNFL